MVGAEVVDSLPFKLVEQRGAGECHVWGGLEAGARGTAARLSGEGGFSCVDGYHTRLVKPLVEFDASPDAGVVVAVVLPFGGVGVDVAKNDVVVSMWPILQGDLGLFLFSPAVVSFFLVCADRRDVHVGEAERVLLVSWKLDCLELRVVVAYFPDIPSDGLERYGVSGTYEKATSSVLPFALWLDAILPGKCVSRDFGVSISRDHLRFLKEHEVDVILFHESLQLFFLCRYGVDVPLHDVELDLFGIFEPEVGGSCVDCGVVGAVQQFLGGDACGAFP